MSGILELLISGPSDSTGDFYPGSLKRTFTAGEAITRGQHVQIDIVGANSTTTAKDFDPDSSTSLWKNVRLPDTDTAPQAGLEHGIFALALEDVASGSSGEFLIWGVAKADAASAANADDALMAAADGELDVITGTSGNKVIALALEDTGDTESGFATVWFNGFGWGQDG